MNKYKFIIYSLLYLTGSKIPSHLKEIRELESLNKIKILKYEEEKLRKILSHAWKKVPYYKAVLEKSGVIFNGKVNLRNFSKIPILTKEIIRKEGKNLYSIDYKKRGSYKNTSGGSTGEPVLFIQDTKYDEWNNATKLYFKEFAAQKVGDKEMRLWGSERDILEGKEKLSIRIRNLLYNRKELNAFRMSEKDMIKFVKKWNEFQPRWIEAYVQSIYEFARFIDKNNIKMYPPKGILVSAGTLYPDMKKLIMKVFRCYVFNRYGSREVGGIACSCGKSDQLHIALWHNHVEILNDNFNAVKPGEMGSVFITTLNNYSMPLIRYQIGDLGMSTKSQHCRCERNGRFIEKIVGRENSILRTKKNTLDSTALTTSFYYFDSIKKYKLIQTKKNFFTIYIVLKNTALWKKDKPSLIEKLHKILGFNVKISIKIVSEISSSSQNIRSYISSKINSDLIDGEYFTHLFYFKDWIKKFQIIQQDYDIIEVKIVLVTKKNIKDMIQIEKNIRFVMGKNCKIKWKFVSEIEPNKSGKYSYVISEVKG